MKNMNLKFGKKEYFRSLTAMLALVTTLSGCSLGNRDLTQDDFDSAVVEDTIEVTPEEYYDDVSDDEDLSEDEAEIEIKIEEEVEEDQTEEDQPVQTQKIATNTLDFSKITFDENLIIPDLSRSSYTGDSIIDALLYEGYPADSRYRAQLAQYFGIINYKRLASQNTLLLHYLRTWNIVDHTVSRDRVHESSSDNTITSDTNNSVHSDTNNSVHSDTNNSVNDSSDNDTNNDIDSSKPEPGQDHEHVYVWKYEDATTEKGECVCGDTKFRGHDYSWEYDKDIDKGVCGGCGDEQTSAHEHEGNPEIVSIQANGDGTHELTTAYDCDLCHEKVEDVQTKDCDYSQNPVNYEQMSSGFAVFNKHKEIRTCSVCNDVIEQEKECVAEGEKQYIRYLSQIYEYFICKLCGNRCEQYPHYTHELGDWESIDDTQHQRECGCTEAEEIGNHTFVYDINANEWNMVCSVCGYTKTTIKHEHATDNMDVWDLMLSPHYSQLVSKSQIKNPNPSPDDYCSRYDFNCPTCGFYSIYYDHDFKDGVCTRVGYCGGIADPNYSIDTTSLEEEIDIDVDTPVEEEVLVEAIPNPDEDVDTPVEEEVPVEAIPNPDEDVDIPVEEEVPVETTPNPDEDVDIPVEEEVPVETTPNPEEDVDTPVEEEVPVETTPNPDEDIDTPVEEEIPTESIPTEEQETQVPSTDLYTEEELEAYLEATMIQEVEEYVEKKKIYTYVK